MKKEDIGKKFNYWTIIGFSDDSLKAQCQCECGKIKDVNFYNVTHNKSKSCGCRKSDRDYSKSIKDLTNQRFGKLIAIEATNDRGSDGSVIWKCQCDCGNICYISSSRLKYRQSCGCIGSPNLIGERFGKLTVIEETKDKKGKKIWKCQCDCGNISYVPTSRLRFGITKSCGCLMRETSSQNGKNCLKDLTGQRFGILTVLSLSQKPNNGHVLWTCQCDCGKIIDVQGNNLQSGNSMSCGCLHFSKGELAISTLLKDNNISFIQHYRNPNFIYPDTKYQMEFDFFVNNEYFIEYDGAQHFQSVSMWGGEERLKLRQSKDNMKNQICFENDFPIIRIPYTIAPNNITLNDLIPNTSKFLVAPNQLDQLGV